MCTFSLLHGEQYKKPQREETVKKCIKATSRQVNAAERTCRISIMPYRKKANQVLTSDNSKDSNIEN